LTLRRLAYEYICEMERIKNFRKRKSYIWIRQKFRDEFVELEIGIEPPTCCRYGHFCFSYTATFSFFSKSFYSLAVWLVIAPVHASFILNFPLFMLIRVRDSFELEEKKTEFRDPLNSFQVKPWVQVPSGPTTLVANSNRFFSFLFVKIRSYRIRPCTHLFWIFRFSLIF
jgi:hypothetical protein